MATIKENGQSYLETQGIEARDNQLAQSDYNASNIYDEKHPDALSDGDGHGKGTGNFGGHGHSVPDMTKPKTQMSYRNFNTTAGGNDCDIQSRETMMNRSLYSAQNRYGIDVVPDTSVNVADGQYDGRQRTRLSHICPVV